ncbi:MAG: asparagine synthase (glutamine-hydrolyzing) [Polyangiaceae bacterium]
MCGIAGLASFGLGAEQGASLVDAMCREMIHRGPDDQGIESNDACSLGMRRLAIVDIVHGHQPMLSDDGRIVLVYNGEVYNAPAIRRRLEAEGVKFKTRSDTEVILRLYERDPDRVEQELVGMWAFAVHDRLRNRLVISRDRFGIKPMFIVRSGKAIAFASELGCFDPIRKDQRFASAFELDAVAAHAMLAWSYVPGESTIYKGVRRLAPSTRIEIDLATGEARERVYYRPAPSADAARVHNIDEACELVESLLRRSVREHLESDVPIACFLSGGIDSSLITAYTADASNTPPTSYSIGFNEKRFDESPFAVETARRIGVPCKVTMLDEQQAKLALADALLAYDEPFGDSSSLATFLLARIVSAEHKVAMGGDGGDEVFAGYRKHKIVNVRQQLSRVPALQQVVASALGKLPRRTDRTSRITDALRTAARASRGLTSDDAQAYVALTQVGSLANTAELIPTASIEQASSRFVHPLEARFNELLSRDATQLQRTLASDLFGPLPNDMLTKVDRATMACSLEARVPFLDHRVVEAGLGLPQELTLGSQGKRVLRTLHERRFGQALANRPKQGFGVPVERWLQTWLAPVCDELFRKDLLDSHGLLSSAALSEGRWRTWAERDPQLLWHAFALAAWAYTHENRSSRRASLRALMT